MIKVLIKKLSHNAKFLIYKTDGSSGMDLMALIEKKITIAPNKSALIPTGLSVQYQMILKFKLDQDQD